MYKTHIKAKIDSRLRSSGTPENFVTFLNDHFTFSPKRSRRYYMRLQDISLPLTFYNINSSFNTFQVIETDGITPHTITITLSEGNYTISEIITELETQLDANTQDANDYTLTYDTKTNKVTFNYVAGSSTSVTIDTIANGSTLNYVLGVGVPVTQTITNLDTTLVLTSTVDSEGPNVVNLNTIDYVYIQTNLTSHNAYLEGDRTNIGAFVPPIGQRNDVIFFENDNGARIELNSKNPLNNLRFTLTDSFRNLIDLNGQNYHFNLVIEELLDDKVTDVHGK